ncbi:MAG TPA: DUF2062 domain-containing protein [Hydrogenophaga sp.]|nr:DUF2062 domain-containing protein [Hydrogenophaga sp.]
MKKRLKSWLPKPETLLQNRWLRWLGPALRHPRLWHFSRKGISLGLALGIFFGLLIPVAQIPAAATLAVMLRANLPMAVASTLVTNPVTFGPVYYGAYRLGKFVLGEPPVSEEEAMKVLEDAQVEPPEIKTLSDRVSYWAQHLGTVGKPLVVGLAIVASASGITVYFLASGIWVLRTRWSRTKRLRDRAARLPTQPQPAERKP